MSSVAAQPSAPEILGRGLHSYLFRQLSAGQQAGVRVLARTIQCLASTVVYSAAKLDGPLALQEKKTKDELWVVRSAHRAMSARDMSMSSTPCSMNSARTTHGRMSAP